jgi:lipopolysaccharide transport system permease protein
LKHNYEQDNWDLVIHPNPGWLNLNLEDIWRYRDLLWMFVKRDFISIYKQTILGPLWFVIQPILTTVMFMVVFTGVAHIPTGHIPSVLFYLSGLTVWNYFSTSLTKISSTFTANAGIFGKVYFPRLVMPLSNVISNLISFAIQFGLLSIFIAYWCIFKGFTFHLSQYVFLLPVVLILLAGLSLGIGIIISSLTTKYRDLTFLLAFGIQLLMYATPVIYPLSYITGKNRIFILANPVSSLVEIFRLAVFGDGTFDLYQLLYSTGFTIVSLLVGIMIFNKVEKNFMDTV